MGTLYYGAARTPITIDDRLLAHLKVVATSKLRRNEPFLVSWDEPAENGSGRGSVFIHPTCDLIYRFDGSRAAELDQQLLESHGGRVDVESGSGDPGDDADRHAHPPRAGRLSEHTAGSARRHPGHPAGTVTVSPIGMLFNAYP